MIPETRGSPCGEMQQHAVGTGTLAVAASRVAVQSSCTCSVTAVVMLAASGCQGQGLGSSCTVRRTPRHASLSRTAEGVLGQWQRRH